MHSHENYKRLLSLVLLKKLYMHLLIYFRNAEYIAIIEHFPCNLIIYLILHKFQVASIQALYYKYRSNFHNLLIFSKIAKTAEYTRLNLEPRKL